MKIEFDPQKSDTNVQERGLSFALVEQFDFETALFKIDDRHDYGEVRIRALGRIGDRVHALVFKETQIGIRVISLRKANRREVRIYEQEITRR
ncbi:MAG: BrnT family toxin [Castellaniella sp.]